MAALFCLVILVTIFITRHSIMECMLAAKWYVITICLIAASIRLGVPRGGARDSLACGAIVATGAFSAILFYATRRSESLLVVPTEDPKPSRQQPLPERRREIFATFH